MRSNYLKTLKTAVLAISVLLLGASVSFAQQQINLAAGPATATLPDGSVVPMWGYSCGTPATGSTATCNPLNAHAPAGGWSPVVITVPTGQDLQINLTNNLTFATSTATPPASAPNNIPTSLVIVGQLGGGLGTVGAGCTAGTTCTTPPDHSMSQQVTWPIASPGTAANTPPTQGPRVQSFGTEVAAGATTSLCWGVCGSSGPALKPGTYLIESGTHPSIQGPMGLYGILVVTTAPGTVAGTAYPNVSYNAEIPLLFSEIDPIQNNAVNAAVNTANFSETAVWSGQPGGCGNPSSATYHTCYPPAVNYTPLYYLINGVAFDKTNSTFSLFPAQPAPGTTNNPTVLVRLVNAGLRMHVPSIVGAQTGANNVPGFGLIAEDGNPLPGVMRVQSEVFMPAGKTYDVLINVPAGGSALPIFDRELSLSGNAIGRDAGMLAYIGINGSVLPAVPSLGVAAKANDDTYSLVAGNTVTVTDPGKGVIANDVNVYGVHLLAAPTGGTVTLSADGTFTYVPSGTTTVSDSFTYCANGTVTGTTCSSGITATVSLGQCSGSCLEAAGGIRLADDLYISNVANHLSVAPPGVLANDTDGDGHPLSVVLPGTAPAWVTLNADGSLSATLPTTGATSTPCPVVVPAIPADATCYSFTYSAQNSQNTASSGTATVTLAFRSPSGLKVSVKDGKTGSPINDYRWVIEEDRTFYIDPNTTTNTGGSSIVPTFGTNFHTSYMPLVATGCIGPQGAIACETGQTVLDNGVACTSLGPPAVPAGCSPTAGQHVPAVCDIGNGVCRPDTTKSGMTAVDPGQVHLDPTKRYYISVLPGDAANPFEAANLTGTCTTFQNLAGTTGSSCGHGMGGAPIAPAQRAVTILAQPTPFPPAKLSVFVFEDDFPLNGEQDGGGGIDVLSPNEPGLGGFNITLFDDAGGTGDATGQMTYDMFNQPLVNSLAGTPDPANGGMDACPISVNSRMGTIQDPKFPNDPTKTIPDPTQTGITGTIVTCPKYEADGVTLSPLAGQAVVANLMPGRYGVVATPAADRIARGEEWLQTNTLDGQKAHDSFLRIGEPSFFQEFGPAGYHVSIGFANPSIINGRKAAVCNGTDPNITERLRCNHTLKGSVSTERMSRTPDERLYGSGSYDSFAFTQCFVSFGDPDGEDFAFTKCDANGNFTLTGLPQGQWRITVFDQWNDMLVDGLSTPVDLGNGNNTTTNLPTIAMNQWQANIYTSTFFDQAKSGVMTDYSGRPCTGTLTPPACNANYGSSQPGLTLVATNIRFRDGSYSNFNNTDLSGNAGFNEVFPLFSWYVVETDTTRYKSTGVHVVYDAGGPADGTCTSTTAPCGNSQIGHFMANTHELVSYPNPNMRVPGARYCANADCPPGDTTGGSTGRVDPPWVQTEGWQGFSGQNSFIEFGKAPFAAGETGGIHGEVIYASTRPFDDPSLLLHTSWTPDVPGVTINLYQEGTAPDGTVSLHLVDTTKTSSWDDWAQGFRTDGIPNMNCPGQGGKTGTNADLFYFSLFNQPMWLDQYNNVLHGTAGSTTPLPANSQFKCYDGMHNWNQVQPAPYDGMYSFPSVASINPATGKPAGTNCHTSTSAEPWGCVPNPDSTDTYRFGQPMLPPGKYVVEMIVPPGYELVKEEDKNILIGDNYIAPVTVEFPGLGSAIYILPDQAEVASLYNAGNAQNPTQTLGRTTFPSSEGDTGSIEVFWPCVGAKRVVPDYISLYPQSQEVAPFAGAVRNLCDRKEVTLTEQTAALAKFWVFTSAHVAAHFTGVITDDFTSEFDPFSPQFGEKFSPPDMPVSIKDWTGTEISRVYADHWGTYDGLTYSTWEVNPPNPTGYAPTMMVTCMNDPGPIAGPGGTMITDPLYNPQYSQFCYEIPFMPGQTQYMDTPVVPTSAFAGAGYNNPDCAYPDATPAIKEVDGDGIGPWVANIIGSVTSVTLNSGGTYTGTPNVTFSPAPAGGATATGTAVISGHVVSVNVINHGTKYLPSQNGAPVTFFPAPPAGGTAAVAHINVSGGTVTSVTVTNGGSGYTSAPFAILPGPQGTRPRTAAFASVTFSATVVAVNLTDGGGGYTLPPTVSFSGGGQTVPASATAAISQTGGVITITALGDQSVPNNAYSGPSASAAPYNAKTVTRHYGFGSTKGTVLVGGVQVPSGNITTWSDSTIVLTVPGGVSACKVQQQAQYGGSKALCGQLVIKAANGKQSIDAVTVTVGGKQPKHVAATDSIQAAIDAADPGDLIIVDPTCTTTTGPLACNSAPGISGLPAGASTTNAAHNELLLMWKPVRLQGVGAASSIINANTHPAGKMDTWREEVNCLFGLALNGQPPSATNPFDPTGSVGCPGKNWNHFVGTLTNPQVDRLPLEATVGWDATLNGNLAELLQEPSLMGALEGAAITVLSKGVDTHGQNPFDASLAANFPTGSTLLGTSAHDCAAGSFPSNFRCNPSSIDGLGITDSSQGGGGIFVHGWGHNLQIANNRINSNAGTLSGGINVGQGEFPPQYLVNGATPNPDPGSCDLDANGNPLNFGSGSTNVQEPYCFNLYVNIHNNSITSNSSTGDELFSATPAGAGGVSICNGSDYYKFQNNWVCGNLSTGDGGGFAHIGFSYNGDIENNTFLFNQSTNPTIPTNGGGLLVMGAPDVDPPCGTTTDQDCVAPVGSVGPSDGTGPNLVINANLIMGNSAESGSGGGLRLQNINGSEVVNFPTTPSRWYGVTITNNVIANNVAGWDGAGISLQDALKVSIINNTIISNDTTASSGMLFNTLGAPLASAGGPDCNNQTGSSTCNSSTSLPQPSGLVSIQNSSTLSSNLPGTITCPPGNFATSPGSANNGTCRRISYPLLANNVFWQNRAFRIGVGALGAGTVNQQNVVTLYKAFTGTPGTAAASQSSTGACDTTIPANHFWDLGVRGDSGPENHASGFTLNPTYSVITDIAGATGYGTGAAHNTAGNPTVVKQYCNGSRIPPEFGGTGYQVPPGISDATVPNPIFSLRPAATVDEGNNWVNMSWGPLSLVHPVTGAVLGNYSPAAGSPVINYIPSSATTNYNEAPGTDFFGNPRKNGSVDAGAVEFVAGGVGTAAGTVSPTSLSFGNVVVGTTSSAQTVTVTLNAGSAPLTGIALTFEGPYSRSGGSCTDTLSSGSCTILVVFSPTAAGDAPGSLTVMSGGSVTGQPVTLSGTGVAVVSLTPLTWSPTAIRNCPAGAGCASDPVQTFTLTNNGATAVTGITAGVLGGGNTADYAIVPIMSTCGTAAGQLTNITTLNQGQSCAVTVHFQPQTGEAAGIKNATVSVTDSAGTQTSILSGTAN